MPSQPPPPAEPPPTDPPPPDPSPINHSGNLYYTTCYKILDSGVLG